MNEKILEKYSKETIEAALKETQDLQKKGYDRAYTTKFANAAKSWCDRGSFEWLTWELVALMSNDGE